MSVKITNNTSAPIEMRVSCCDCGHAFYDHDEDGLCAACQDLLDDLPGGAQGAHVAACPSLDPDITASDYLRRHPELLDELAGATDDNIDREIESALVDEVRRSELS